MQMPGTEVLRQQVQAPTSIPLVLIGATCQQVYHRVLEVFSSNCLAKRNLETHQHLPLKEQPSKVRAKDSGENEDRKLLYI